MLYNERNNTWLWKPDHDIRTPQDLLKLVEVRYKSSIPPQPLGFKLADLRDSYPASREAVETFAKRRKRSEVEEERVAQGGEDEGAIEHESKKILILPGSKEGSIRQVFFNEASSEAYIRRNEGNIIGTVDEGELGKRAPFGYCPPSDFRRPLHRVQDIVALAHRSGCCRSAEGARTGRAHDGYHGGR